jgi:hypothetical protein
VPPITPPAAHSEARHHVPRTERRRRTLIQVAIVVMVLILVIPLEFVREATADWLVEWVDAAVGSGPTAMAVAGWLTFALLPIVMIVVDRDMRRRYGAPEVDVRTDTTVLMQRVKATRGHRVAGPSRVHWLVRSPLYAVAALAVIFLPLRGMATGVVNGWRRTYGGAAFVTGWHWSVPAAMLGAILIVGTPLYNAVRPRRAAPPVPQSRVYAVAAALPLVSLVIALLLV